MLWQNDDEVFMKYIKNYLLTVFIFVFSLFAFEQVYCFFSSSLPYQELDNAIRKKNINHIFVQRRSPCSPLSINKAFCIFALLDKILGGDGFLKEQEAIVHLAESTHEYLDRFDPEIEEVYSVQCTEEVKKGVLQFLTKLGRFPKKFNDKKWTFVVFSEMFFSSTHALDTQSIQELLRYCNLLTQKHNKLIVVINFLHAFNNKKRPHWMPHNFSTIPLSKSFISGPLEKLMINGKKIIKTI